MLPAHGLGNVYLAGYTTGSLDGPSARGDDAFVTRFKAAGVLHCRRQFGTAPVDMVYGVSSDGTGNVYPSDYATGSLAA
ncbi:hypothetical protein [Lacipirellula limnantheis]|uniref:Uncharacterized protein n=1 Tax=Lacipirellula limnantheis TaxID=2528024 RepID=A0A517TYD9_9BACT|nr:hypothetical protein [Lacipirellula limnantheis]QDT73381.1 hypothetical protein I41_25700 [Lacipirellula limnantheis]